MRSHLHFESVVYISRGWFNIEEIKNGVISEEALDKIAGGLKLPKEIVKKSILAWIEMVNKEEGDSSTPKSEEKKGETPALDNNQQNQANLAGTQGTQGTQGIQGIQGIQGTQQ